jgi:hypothetical protein
MEAIDVKTLTPDPLLPQHPQWDEFLNRLYGPDGCNFKTTWTCSGTTEKPLSRRILADMGLSAAAIEATLAYFEEHGGYCDCEVILNVGERE